MPKIVNIGICQAEECGRQERSRGYCMSHYAMLLRRGTIIKLVRKKRSHPLYGTWWDRKQYNSLGKEFLDFWVFVQYVKERPSKNHYLVRLDNSNPYTPDNFIWQEHLKRRDGESQKKWYARKWQERKKNFPSFDKDRQIKRKFGIDRAEYNRMLMLQDYKCAICKDSETAFEYRTGNTKSLAVDHCHIRKKIRGLLCFSCNSVLGKMNDSIERLESMINYLKRNE